MSSFGGSNSGGYHHRSTYTKAHKPFKGKSKGKLERVARGKIDGTSSNASTNQSVKVANQTVNQAHSKLARTNRAKQIQSMKRSDLMAAKRVGSRDGPPRLIALIPLSQNTDLNGFIERIRAVSNTNDQSINQQNKSSMDDTIDQSSNPASIQPDQSNLRSFDWTFGSQRRRFQFFTCPRNQNAILDAAKVADIICFVLSPNDDYVPASCDEGDECLDLDAFGAHAVTLLKAQGVQSIIGVTVPGKKVLKEKQNGQFKRTAQRYFHTAFSDDMKVQTLGECTEEPSTQQSINQSINQANQLLRWLTELKLKNLVWREHRVYMLGQSIQYDASSRMLAVTGYLRGGRTLNANQLIHLTGFGDYQIDRIEAVADVKVKKAPSSDQRVVVSQSTVESRESLVSFNDIDPLAHDQSIITDEELAEAEGSDDDMQEDDMYEDAAPPASEPVPQDAQSAWNEVLGLSDDDDESKHNFAESDMQSEMDSTVGTKQKLERDEVDYPDEVTYPMETICRERFARYRGLKSFKQSPWDVRENLPLEYGQIFQFSNFKHSRAIAWKDEAADSTDIGVVHPDQASAVTLYLLDVDQSVYESMHQLMHQSLAPLCLFGLLNYEHKVSVCHYLVSRYAEYSAPIKNKEELEFHCGFRRSLHRPIFTAHRSDSDDKNTSRALVQRYFHTDRFVVASCYQRIMFPPAPVILFKPMSDADVESTPTINPIVASGSLLSVDPDRLLLKRVLLTGAPISTHKRHAVVRHMFFNAGDVAYFKPVELHTKHGLVGHVIESRGTKGHMKCLFDGHIKENDTVCLALYKRQYPPWNSELFGEH